MSTHVRRRTAGFAQHSTPKVPKPCFKQSLRDKSFLKVRTHALANVPLARACRNHSNALARALSQ
eukprot:7030664-Pyramimonas_sp.AAC.1